MTKEEWLQKYKARLIERGLTEEDAEDSTKLASTDSDLAQHYSDYDPKDAADDELSNGDT